MSSLDKTMHFDFNQNKGKNVYDTLQDVYNTLKSIKDNNISKECDIVVSQDTAKWAKVALERMFEV